MAISQNIALGHRSIYPSGFLVGAEIGYQYWKKDPSVELVSGSSSLELQRELERSWENRLSFSVAFGFEF